MQFICKFQPPLHARRLGSITEGGAKSSKPDCARLANGRNLLKYPATEIQPSKQPSCLDHQSPTKKTAPQDGLRQPLKIAGFYIAISRKDIPSNSPYPHPA